MPKRVLMAMVSMGLAMTAHAVDLPVANPGFEHAPEGDPRRATAWFEATPTSVATADDTVARSGNRSLRLQYRAPFSGVTQVLDATAYRGQTVLFRAMLRSRDLGPGTTGLWIRADSANRKAAAFAHTYAQALDGTRDWTAREVALKVPADATQLMFGAVIGAEGGLWIDDVELSAPQMPEPSAVSTARNYLDTALDLIQQQAYYADRIDWQALRETSHALAKDARQPADTYPAIRHALASLGDRHSHLVSPDAMARQLSEETRDDYGVTSATFGSVAYVRVPGFTGVGQAPGAAFAAQIRTALRAQADEGACGWIVDLRGNMGGNMHPMLAGLRDLLGDGDLGFFVNRDGRKPWRAMGNGTPTLTDAPVAVLIDGRTASSGEAVLLSFVGRPQTRSFGAGTFGVSTVNTVLPLSDGASIALTVGVQADRSGQIYGSVIAPDQVVPAAASRATLEEEDAVTAARSWLLSRPACATSKPNT